MSHTILFALNLRWWSASALLLRRKDLLGYAKGGKWYLTWLAIGVITLMDELTSVFYAPAEAHRFIGTQAIFFIAFTSLLMRFLSSRMVEIAQILERNDMRGGGVYSFSYLVLGPAASFVAVASIMVDYILTACISTVSAVINGTAFLPIGAGDGVRAHPRHHLGRRRRSTSSASARTRASPSASSSPRRSCSST